MALRTSASAGDVTTPDVSGLSASRADIAKDYLSRDRTTPVHAVLLRALTPNASPFRPRRDRELPYTHRCTLASMKRRELEKRLAALGWRFLRHGGKHDVWT